MPRVTQRAPEMVRDGTRRDTRAHNGLWMDLRDPEYQYGSPNDLPAKLAPRFVLGRIPFPRRGDFPLALHGITALFKDTIAPQNVSPRLDSGDLGLTTAVVRLGLVNRSHVGPDVIDNMVSSFSKTLRRAIVGMFRGTRLSSVKWLGSFLRFSGAAILSGGVPAHAGWFQGFETDNSLSRVLGGISRIYVGTRARRMLLNGASAPGRFAFCLLTMRPRRVISSSSSSRLMCALASPILVFSPRLETRLSSRKKGGRF